MALTCFVGGAGGFVLGSRVGSGMFLRGRRGMSVGECRVGRVRMMAQETSEKVAESVEEIPKKAVEVKAEEGAAVAEETKAEEVPMAEETKAEGAAVPDVDKAEVPFEIRGFSLANLAVVLGFLVTGYSFYEYFSSSGVATTSSLGFVYGVPILLIGFALKYAELKPVPIASTPQGRALRETKATAIQKKVIQDVTRHRYGDEQHLDAALKSLGLIPRGSACPELLELLEEEENGEYALSLKFFSKETPFSTWEEKCKKCENFFGPNIRASVSKVDAANRIVALKLVSLTSSESSE